MRSTATALFWMAIAAGNYGSTLLVSIVHTMSTGQDGSNWLPDENLNKGAIFLTYYNPGTLSHLDQIAIGDTIADASTMETINDTISKAKIKVKELIKAAQDKKVRARAWSNDDGVL
ncbi:NRT1/ PTR family 3.1-like protein [Tanacetum coccineum]